MVRRIDILMGYYDKAIKEREDSLSHHGILGQKWGVRRFQNRDGSLTALGRARKGEGSSKHKFVKKDISIDRRKDTLDSVLQQWGRAEQKRMIENTISEIEKQEDGARGAIGITWNGTRSGHSIAYSNEGGKVVLWDTQSNERYEGKDLQKYLEKASQLSVTRLDNCAINYKYIKEVAK